jgi:mycothiol synthase
MTLDDLRAREADDWFSGDDLLLLRDDSGQLAGSCWLKVEGDTGEFYAVAVRPDLQGRGLGGVLMRAGTARLTGRGLSAAALYVEGDNAPALALYRRSGFEQHAIDVQYAAG